jgi:hypothetical protein
VRWRYIQLNRKLRREKTHELNSRTVVVIIAREAQVNQQIVRKRVRQIATVELEPKKVNKSLILVL